MAVIREGVITKQPLSTNGVIIVRDGTNTVYAFERDSGRWQWQVSRDSPTDFSMQGQGALFLNTDQLLVGYSDGFLVSYSVSKGGKKLWSVPIGESQEDFRDLDGNLGLATIPRRRNALYRSNIGRYKPWCDSRTNPHRWRVSRFVPWGLTGRHHRRQPNPPCRPPIERAFGILIWAPTEEYYPSRSF